ncbi:amino acid ABC transporter ATP-binding protein [Alsobacter sp. SYSU M60028]|uniref:Amino acid ABC transporter ATP-binding protein n=1 Tax=Alsobacter ponti TaxID=2962936 RepID=A0ABT1LHK9_9HYPH|nr:amino acid ABC transporter ATP-binding protein [Alsobacter ponti]
MVRMRGVRKAFGPRVILEGLDLDVGAGEKVALIGPSGSGKTTILRLLIGLTEPDAGTIEIDGQYLWHSSRGGTLERADEAHARQVRRCVGMVFQQFNLFPHMTALQNVHEPMEQVLRLKRPEAKERARALLARVGLGEHVDKRPSQLSGGQQQRVAIARSLGLQPKLMLFDEVTSALDPELVGEVLGVLRELAHETDMTMLIVTHEIRFAADIADRVLVFDAGRVVEDGSPEIVLKDPSHPRTRQFLRAILER